MPMLIIAVLFWGCVLVILYALVGYPLIISLIAKGRGRREYFQTNLPTVTLMIPAYNEEVIIGRKIENSLALNYPKDKLQILVTADGSSDRTPDIVQEYAAKGIELSYTPERGGKMAAINRAIGLVRGEIIVFSDANNFYEENAIRKLVAPFEDESVGGTTGSKRIIEDERDLSSAEGFYWKYESAIKLNESIVSSCTAAVGEMFAIRKTAFEFPPSNIINDDRYMVVDLIRREYRVEYVPEAKSFEYVSASAKDEMKRRRRMTAGGFQFMAMSGEILPKGNWLEVWKIVSHKYLRNLMPIFMILALLTNILAVIFSSKTGGVFGLQYPINWIFLILQLGFYGLALLGNLFPKKSKSKLTKVLYLPTFFVNSNLAILSGLFLFLQDKESHLWERVQRVE